MPFAVATFLISLGGATRGGMADLVVGDDVAWLTAGTAALGGLLAVALR